MGWFNRLRQRAETGDPVDDRTAERVLDMALRQAEDFGMRRFTIDDLARRVGLSRVTIYRHFPKKDLLINALLTRELHRFLSKAETVVEAQPTPWPSSPRAWCSAWSTCASTACSTGCCVPSPRSSCRT
ncbi:TetR family transcriptional regulator [Actinomadura sp. J1-007]|uniref:TetR/AcrR family transcriptional regulator n=1 Tax=Actinomadura sp. J1-007 TaxID=2661913 RepID=UPI0013249ED6|nr:TetR/AcrR family transcriptional regulator [Actinomadura sp. J1-007]MWK38501.1 TetR family transcriptional regulator [Actinomadura sp. J1-007]